MLLPVLDDAKHYWVSTEEVDKLIRAGGGWLAGHPEKELITRRYLSHQKKLTRSALARLAEADDTEPDQLDNAVPEETTDKPLAVQRREAILAVLREAGARRVGDLGCGAGALTRDLLRDTSFDHVVATDVSARALQLAARHLNLERMPDKQRERLTIFQSSLTYRDDRLAGLDAAVLMEVIEHLDPDRIPALERVVFGAAAPATVVVTTPNAELETTWLLLDAEIVPWNVKAVALLRDQYAAVGAAALAALPAAASALEQAVARGLPGVGELLDRTRSRRANAEAFTAAYLRYCWATDGLAGVRVAPFQLLAAEGAVYHERPHLSHLALADRLAAGSRELITATRRIEADTGDPASVAAAIRWWEELTAAGGEGMVVKPAANLTRATRRGSGSGQQGLVQPGLKVRGREYLRLIYGPDYTEPANLARLRQRALSHKRSLALREYALGLEALDRVARGEPLWRVHECVFAVLALESEPVDPRL